MLAPAGPDRQHYEPVSSAAPPNASSLPWPSGALTLAATTAANGQQATGWIIGSTRLHLGDQHRKQLSHRYAGAPDGNSAC